MWSEVYQKKKDSFQWISGAHLILTCSYTSWERARGCKTFESEEHRRCKTHGVEHKKISPLASLSYLYYWIFFEDCKRTRLRPRSPSKDTGQYWKQQRMMVIVVRSVSWSAQCQASWGQPLYMVIYRGHWSHNETCDQVFSLIPVGSIWFLSKYQCILNIGNPGINV